MPSTNVFYHYNFSRFSSVGETTEGKLAVCELSTLKEQEFFKEAVDAGIEQLISTWQIKKNGESIIKYAANNKLGFIFSSDRQIDNLLQKFPHNNVDTLDYVQELRFFHFLNEYNQTFDELKNTAGVNDKKIQLLVKHNEGFASLLEKGITFPEIGSVQESVMEGGRWQLKRMRRIRPPFVLYCEGYSCIAPFYRESNDKSNYRWEPEINKL